MFPEMTSGCALVRAVSDCGGVEGVIDQRLADCRDQHGRRNGPRRCHDGNETPDDPRTSSRDDDADPEATTLGSEGAAALAEDWLSSGGRMVAVALLGDRVGQGVAPERLPGG